MKYLLSAPITIFLIAVSLICILWFGIEIDAYKYRNNPINWLPLIIVSSIISFYVGLALIEYYLLDRIRRKEQKLKEHHTQVDEFYKQRKRLEKD